MNNPRYLTLLCAVFALCWTALAIAPHDRADWALENFLTGVFAVALFLGRHRYPLSATSWTLLLAFALIHTLGSHYTYSLVPYEAWGREWLGFSVNGLLGWERNNFDRVVHFLWGFLLYLPVQEWFMAGTPGLRGGWRSWFPLEFIMATSLVYELIEWAAAEVFGGELGAAYLGTQGDIWDAQKDMALATAGGLTMMLILVLRSKLAHTYKDTRRT